MSDEEYDNWINTMPTAEERISAALRESRFVTGWFPAYSSGATDLIEQMLKDMKQEWVTTIRNYLEDRELLADEDLQESLRQMREGMLGPAVTGEESGEPPRHNHMTRDVKPEGQCPACDARRHSLAVKAPRS